MPQSQSSRPLPPASFEDWVRWVFDHPVTKPEWHWKDSLPRPRAEEALTYMTKLFEDPERHLHAYSDAQLNQGLWFLTSNSHSEHIYAFTNVTLPENQRLRGVRAIGALFARLFAKRCSNHLSHLDDAGAGALNPICYMLWDVAPLPRFHDHAALEAVNVAAIDVMERCLALDNDACRESALHGFGENHWFKPIRPRIHNAIDAFLANTPNLRPELIAYARRARSGHVL